MNDTLKSGLAAMQEQLSSLGELLLIEFQFLAFQDVAVATADLSRAGRDAGQQATGSELLLEGSIERLGLAALLNNFLGLLANFLLFLLFLLDDLLAELTTIPLLIVVSEGGGIDLDDAVLHERLRTNQLVVGRVVHDIQDTGAAGAAFSPPAEVARVQRQSSEFEVASTDTHDVHLSLLELGVGSRTTHLILSFLLVDIATTTRQTMFVS